MVVEFTSEVAGWSPARFVDEVVRPLHPVRVVVGENFRFGFRAAGTVGHAGRARATPGRGFAVTGRAAADRRQPAELVDADPPRASPRATSGGSAS